MILPAEYQVLAAAATPGGTTAARPPDNVWSGVRWHRLTALADWHRLGPLLHRRVALPDEAPDHVSERLELDYLETAARNLYLLDQLTVIQQALDAEGIRAMPLKGAALVQTVYPEPALRPMRDLDILVAPSMIARAQQAVVALGFRAVPPVAGVEGSEGWMATHHHHLPALVSPGEVFAVELHHHIVGPSDPSHFEISGFWERARPGENGSRVFPAPEDLLVHVALHFTRNRLWRSDGSMGQLADVAWIVEREPLDWEALIARAGPDNVAASLFIALYSAQRLLGLAVPADALNRLQPPGFHDRQGQRFVECRVLRDRSWLPLEYLTKRRPPMMRAIPDRAYLARQHGGNGTTSVSSLYVHRAAAAVRRYGPSLVRPRERIADLRLNRWMRSLERRT
ncbi:MAG TPA: nucleotidyltransferase family protein [Acidimicrobiales bacterium]|nr:nucleotidyltransferase family protein [Acidimicrobiales bacterium]